MRKLVTPQIWAESLIEAERNPWMTMTRSIRLEALSDLEEQGYEVTRFPDKHVYGDLRKALIDACFDWTPTNYFYLNASDLEPIAVTFGNLCWDCGNSELLDYTPQLVSRFDVEYRGKYISANYWYELWGSAWIGRIDRHRTAMSCGNCAKHGGIVRLEREIAREMRADIRKNKELKICQKLQKNLKAMLRGQDRAVWPSLLTESIQAKTSLT